MDAQESAIRDRIEAEGWTLTELYSDPAQSGSRGDRPALLKMLAALDEFDVLLVSKVDRLGRRAAGLLQLFETLEAAKVRLLPLGDPEFDSKSATGRMLPRLLAVLAQMEAEQVGERVASSAKQRAAEHRHHGTAAFGYRAVKGQLQPNDQAPLVRRIFAEAAEGISRHQIARTLNAEGVKTARAGRWTSYSIGLLLANVTYRGEIPFKGEILPGDHVAIVDPRLWARAQKRAAVVGGRPGPGREPAGAHLFTKGLLVCGYCGAAMKPRTNKARKRETYECATRQADGPASCPQTPIKRAPLDLAALSYFEDVGLDVEAMKVEVADAVRRRREVIDAQLKAATTEQADAEARLARITRDYQDEQLDAAEFELQRGRLAEEIEAAGAQTEQATRNEAAIAEAERAAADPAPVVVEQLEAIRAAVAGKLAASNLTTLRRVLGELFERFVVVPADKSAAVLPAAEQALADAAREEIRKQLAAAGSEPFESPGYHVIPWPRQEALAGLDEAFRPILKRRGLGDDTIGKPNRLE